MFTNSGDLSSPQPRPSQGPTVYTKAASPTPSHPSAAAVTQGNETRTGRPVSTSISSINTGRHEGCVSQKDFQRAMEEIASLREAFKLCVPVKEAEQVIGSLRDEIASLRSRLKEATQRLGVEMDATITALRAPHATADTGSQKDSVHLSKASSSMPAQRSRNRKNNAASKIAVPPPSLSNNPHPQGPVEETVQRTDREGQSSDATDLQTISLSGVSVDNRFQALASESEGGATRITQPVARESNPKRDTDPASQSRPSEQTKSPEDTLQSIKVSRECAAVLIGDSVVRYVNPRRLPPRLAGCQKICVPGMTRVHLLSWLRRQPPCPSVQLVTVHVGVNDCTSGPIAKDGWADLVGACRSVFPRASLRLSSILPPFSPSHNLNNTVAPSNRDLQSVCSQLGASFIDHTDTFRTARGLPRKALYSDLKHPSSKSTAKLALALSQSPPLTTPPQPHHHSPPPPPRPSSLEDYPPLPSHPSTRETASTPPSQPTQRGPDRPPRLAAGHGAARAPHVQPRPLYLPANTGLYNSRQRCHEAAPVDPLPSYQQPILRHERQPVPPPLHPMAAHFLNLASQYLLPQPMF